MGRLAAIFLLAMIGLVLGAGTLRAGTVRLKNGDRITGVITYIGAKHVHVKTTYAGTLAIPLTDVKTLSSAVPVLLTPGQAAACMVTLTPAPGGDGWIETPLAMSVPPSALAAIKPDQPISWFGSAWQNEVDLGLTNATGNSTSTQATGALNLHYHHASDDVNLSFIGGYGVTNGAQSLGFAQSDEIWRRALDEFKSAWAKKIFLYEENNNRYDAILGISLRSNNDVGLGYYILNSKAMELDVRGGPGYTYEQFFHGQINHYISGTAGLHFQCQIISHLQFVQTLSYIASLQNVYNYQASATSALSMDLPEVARGFGLRASFTDNYDNTAGELGRKRNDTLALASIFFKF